MVIRKARRQRGGKEGRGEGGAPSMGVDRNEGLATDINLYQRDVL